MQISLKTAIFDAGDIEATEGVPYNPPAWRDEPNISGMHKTMQRHEPVAPARPAASRRPGIHRLLLVQLGIVVAVTTVLVFETDNAVALSALMGGMTGVLPNAYSAWRAFLFRGARFRRQMISSLYRAQAGKHFLTILLFTGIFITSPPQSPEWFFGTFALVQSVYWLSPWLISRSGSL